MIRVDSVHCFLVHPGKGIETPPQIGGTSLPNTGQPFGMLKAIFDNAESDCSTDIAFRHGPSGQQQNDCRDAIMKYLSARSIDDGRTLANRLQAVTTNRPGLGLLFLISGQHEGHSKLVVSRFPADQGILAEEARDGLTVEFLEKVFMKSSTAYKAVLYSGTPSVSTAFWTGRAVDKQVNVPGELAQYWINNFLESELRTTSAAGTKRLADALRAALQQSTDTAVKAELTSAATLAASLDGQVTSVDKFCEQFVLSDPAIDSIRKAIKHETLLSEEFQFDADEFGKHVAFRSVELDSGGLLTADALRFDEVFHQEPVDNGIRFTTEGRIVDERLKKTRV